LIPSSNGRRFLINIIVGGIAGAGVSQAGDISYDIKSANHSVFARKCSFYGANRWLTLRRFHLCLAVQAVHLAGRDTEPALPISVSAYLDSGCEAGGRSNTEELDCLTRSRV